MGLKELQAHVNALAEEDRALRLDALASQLRDVARQAAAYGLSLEELAALAMEQDER